MAPFAAEAPDLVDVELGQHRGHSPEANDLSWPAAAPRHLGGALGHGLPPAQQGHRSLRQVAPIGHLPLVVGLDHHRGDQALDGGVVGEDPDHVGAALDLSMEALERVGRPDLAPVDSGKAVKASRSSLASLSMVATSGNWP